ncbi:MAG: Na+/H+ antiporter NhaA [Taibaiella sp.]|jgi:NhaA family Na+:H+ antiporter
MKKRFSILKKIFISPIEEFIHDSRSVGITLLICTVVSLIISNTGWGNAFVGFWEKDIHLPFENIHLPHSVAHWINDGLMAVFFLLVGMEIKRELLTGELSSLKKSILPVLAAIGGMLFPALLYYGWNTNSGFPQGWGVPMATDIAFSLGILSLLGKRVPLSLKILLTALAIIDDLGAIVAIAVFYTDHIDWIYLGVGGAILLVLFLMNKFNVKVLLPYFILGLGLWYCLFNSGVHATLAGVLLAFTIPIKKIHMLEHKLHDPVSFIILPLFALANTAIIFPAEISIALTSPINYGILSGLIIGKPLGIALISYCAVKLKLATLPEDLNWKYIIGMGMLAGIGFTMSIFISMLAFKDFEAQTTAKLAVLIASFVSGVGGFLFLKVTSKAS